MRGTARTAASDAPPLAPATEEDRCAGAGEGKGAAGKAAGEVDGKAGCDGDGQDRIAAATVARKLSPEAPSFACIDIPW